MTDRPEPDHGDDRRHPGLLRFPELRLYIPGPPGRITPLPGATAGRDRLGGVIHTIDKATAGWRIGVVSPRAVIAGFVVSDGSAWSVAAPDLSVAPGAERGLSALSGPLPALGAGGALAVVITERPAVATVAASLNGPPATPAEWKRRLIERLLDSGVTWAEIPLILAGAPCG